MDLYILNCIEVALTELIVIAGHFSTVFLQWLLFAHVE